MSKEKNMAELEKLLAESALAAAVLSLKMTEEIIDDLEEVVIMQSNALCVIALTDHIRAYLLVKDPKALEQVYKAIRESAHIVEIAKKRKNDESVLP